ncbi:MAG: ABC transporter substrate-binding protein [Anaerovoracaceae bacterium]
MRHNNPKKILITLLCVILALGLISCGTNKDNATSTKKVVYTDSVGRKVEVPAEINKIAPTGSLSQIILYTVAPQKLIGWASSPSEEMQKYFLKDTVSLPTFGSFFGKNADLNMEALIKAAPQVIIDIGEIQGDKKSHAKSMDGLQEQVGIPVVFIEAKMDSTADAYKKLGDLLHVEKKAEKLSAYCKKTLYESSSTLQKVPASKHPKLYYGEGETGLETNVSGSFHSEVIERTKASNVVKIKETTKEGGNQISMEQLLVWQPDAILFAPRSIYSKVESDPLWSKVTAVQKGHYYEIPEGPFNWIDRPPSVNRFLGLQWLNNLLYPDYFKYDMIDRTKEFYDLFYHYYLSDKEAKELLGHSTFANK